MFFVCYKFPYILKQTMSLSLKFSLGLIKLRTLFQDFLNCCRQVRISLSKFWLFSKKYWPPSLLLLRLLQFFSYLIAVTSCYFVQYLHQVVSSNICCFLLVLHQVFTTLCVFEYSFLGLLLNAFFNNLLDFFSWGLYILIVPRSNYVILLGSI